MKTIILVLAAALIALSCKKSDEKFLDDVLPMENYFTIDDQKYALDSLSVTYQNTKEGGNFQITAINKAHNSLLILEYLVLETKEGKLLPGDFSYQRTENLEILSTGHFYNLIAKYDTAKGDELLLDGLGGNEIEEGLLKIKKDASKYEIVLASRIANRKVTLQYNGEVVPQEFDW